MPKLETNPQQELIDAISLMHRNAVRHNTEANQRAAREHGFRFMMGKTDIHTTGDIVKGNRAFLVKPPPTGIAFAFAHPDVGISVIQEDLVTDERIRRFAERYITNGNFAQFPAILDGTVHPGFLYPQIVRSQEVIGEISATGVEAGINYLSLAKGSDDHQVVVMGLDFAPADAAAALTDLLAFTLKHPVVNLVGTGRGFVFGFPGNKYPAFGTWDGQAYEQIPQAE